jgi:hypothetical protein
LQSGARFLQSLTHRYSDARWRRTLKELAGPNRRIGKLCLLIQQEGFR